MKLYLFILLTIAGCASDSVFKEQAARTSLPLCYNNKPAQNYSLTIYAYGDVEKNIFISKASEKLQSLGTTYDLFANKVIPQLLLNSYIRRYQNNKKDDRDAIEFAVMGFAVLDYTFIPESFTQNAEMMNWSEWGASNAFAKVQTQFKTSEYELTQSTASQIDKMSFIPTGAKGEELVICPTSTCANLFVPRINKTIEEISTTIGGKAIKAYGVQENHFDKIQGVNHFNKFNKFYFLYDILSKSGLTLGNQYLDSYYVVPEFEQEKLCKDVKTKLSNYPDGCFKNSFQTYSEFENFGDDLQKIPEATFQLRQTHLSKSGAFQCCQLLENGKVSCNSTHDKPCYSTDIQKMTYMDSVARDYADKITFNIEKKNEGKWTIYKIRINPEFFCKYGRPRNEMLTK